jgi:hypothetical protein
MSTKVSQLEWDITFNALSEEQKTRVLSLALRLMPTEPPEPGDQEAIDEHERRNRFTFTSAREIADYFGIAE